jgi:hypothetical protein
MKEGHTMAEDQGGITQGGGEITLGEQTGGTHTGRPDGKEIKRLRKERRQAFKELRRRQRAEGLVGQPKPSIPNRVCGYESVEEEKAARLDAVTEQIRVFRAQLPVLLKRLDKIPDPRNPKKIRHKATVMMIYGILTFVFHMASRREANREMTRPIFLENLRQLFPELEDLPHQDTLNRFLAQMDVNQIEQAHVELIQALIRKKKFCRYLIGNCYPIAVDGTEKFSRYHLWAEQCLEQRVRDGDGHRMRYYVYALEANLAFHNGMVIPLLTEVLNYTEGDQLRNKQDCELNAFKRLAKRLKGYFPRLPIMVLLDGLYPNGPIMALCHEYKWDFMMVLQNDSLLSVWEEVYGLKELEGGNELRHKWGNRRQHFWWVNDIEYWYRPADSSREKKEIVHVVVCEESWEDLSKDSNEVVERHSFHAWISSKALSGRNVHERCNLGARYRWGIEDGILVEKHHGYRYEHSFSYDWNAMRGYHYLMRLGHAINVLAQYSTALVKVVRQLTVQGFIRFVRQTLSGPWLNPEEVKQRMGAAFQLRLL